MKTLYLVIYQNVTLHMGGHGLFNQSDGQFRLLIPYHANAALVEHVIEGRSQEAHLQLVGEQEVPAVREDGYVAGHHVEAGEIVFLRNLAVVFRRPLLHILKVGVV